VSPPKAFGCFIKNSVVHFLDTYRPTEWISQYSGQIDQAMRPRRNRQFAVNQFPVEWCPVLDTERIPNGLGYGRLPLARGRGSCRNPCVLIHFQIPVNSLLPKGSKESCSAQGKTGERTRQPSHLWRRYT
jgi:hypothetical protein